MIVGLIAIWGLGILVLPAIYLNDLSRVHNNFLPGSLQTAPPSRLGSYYGSFRFSRIDPELLTESGRIYRQRGILHERICFAWLLLGFIAILTPYWM